MSFLSPWSALIAAAIAVPLLLLLYFLRLRRQRLRIASTLLWQKSFEDLQVNAPFQRLRWSLLLLLQLLLLLALLLALAEPVIRGEAPLASRIVLLIDRSASMNASIGRSSPPSGSTARRTRLDAAKDAAARLAREIGETGQPSQMMVIAFGNSAQIVSSFDADRAALLEAIESIGPSDEQADLDAALQLAGAFASASEQASEQPPDVLLLSDGGVNPASESQGHSVRAGVFRFMQVAPHADVDNVGIATFSARRDYEDPARVLVFARLVNAGSESVETIVTLSVDDQPAAVVRTTVPPANESGVGEQSFTRSLEIPGGAVLSLRHNHRDDLPDDDAAWMVLPAPARPRIALVHPSDVKADPFLHDLLEALEPQRLDVISQAAFDILDAAQLDSGGLYDVVVFDRVSAARLPGVPSLTFGGTPAPLRNMQPESRPSTSASRPAAETGSAILSWDRQHPVMRNVSLDTIVYAGFGAYELPAGATPLAWGPEGPIIAALRTRGARHVAVGFDLIKSNWPLHVSIAVFLQNAMDYLTLAESGQSGLTFRPGEPMTLRSAGDAHELVISGPVDAAIPIEPGSTTTTPAPRFAGLYAVRGAAAPFDRIAVSVLSDVESDIRPRESVTVNSQAAGARRAAAAAPRPLWQWLVAAGFALLVLEWLVYCRRVRGRP